MKDCIKICLPNGKVHKMVLTTDKVTDDVITKLREMIGRVENFQVQVEVDPFEFNEGVKQKTLILWGDFLKNCHIVVERY